MFGMVIECRRHLQQAGSDIEVLHRGFTIINDITARERQRDHKQFFLGKSADTFCPMVSHLLSILPLSLGSKTHVGPGSRSHNLSP